MDPQWTGLQGGDGQGSVYVSGQSVCVFLGRVCVCVCVPGERECVCTWVVLDETLVQVSQLLSRDVSGWVVRRLEVQVVLPSLEELRGSHVHADDDLVRVPCLLDGRLQQLQGWGEGEMLGKSFQKDF